MKITAAEQSPRQKGMRRIHLDGAYAFSLPEEVYLRMRLYEREDLSEPEVLEIRDTVLRKAVREQAILYLTVLDRTAAGLLERLVRAGYDGESAALAVADMITLGYVDDRRYAQRYISEQLRAKSVSRKNMRFALRARGVSDEDFDAVISEFEQDDEETALRGARKKFGKYDLTDPAIERKAVSFLLHRGFNYETVQQILRRMKEETD